MKQDVALYKLAPLEYRVGLDAASTWLAQQPPLKLYCEQPALLGEAAQRLPAAEAGPSASGLWIEPQISSWQAVLEVLALELPPGGRLAVLLSRPLSRRLPERRDWQGTALGERPGGVRQLVHALHHHGLRMVTLQGLHSGQATLLLAAAALARKAGTLARADRLEFAARQRYIQAMGKAWGATCALILAERS